MSRFLRSELSRKIEVFTWLGAPVLFGVLILANAPVNTPSTRFILDSNEAFTGRLLSFQQ